MIGVTVHLIHPGFWTASRPNSEPTMHTAMPISRKSRCQLFHQDGCLETITTPNVSAAHVRSVYGIAVFNDYQRKDGSGNLPSLGFRPYWFSVCVEGMEFSGLTHSLISLVNLSFQSVFRRAPLPQTPRGLLPLPTSDQAAWAARQRCRSSPD